MDYDLIIIGAGWAGISAAREALSRGLKTCLIEASQTGGTCLNRGCIPTKSLLEDPAQLPLAQQHKDALVSLLRQGAESSLKGVERISGTARVSGPGTVTVNGTQVHGRSLIIASGSLPAALGGFVFDHQRIVSSDDMLGWTDAPKSLLIIGAGALGLEFAEMFAGRGTQVTVAEAQPRILPSFDEDVSRKIAAALEKKGIVFRGGWAPKSLDECAAFEKIAVCAGRKPALEGLDLERAGIACSEKGIVVDGVMQTSLHGVYAAGDCTGLNMQAHAAALQGRIAAAACSGQDGQMPFSSYIIPQAVFTHPGAAGAGLTQSAAQGKGMNVSSRTVSLLANPMARIRGDKDGLVKVIWETASERLLGAWIVSAAAAELIAVFSLALQQGLTRSQLRRTVMVHPSLSESLVD